MIVPKRLPKRDPIAAYKRKVTAARRIGQGNKCDCGEARPEALIAGSDPVICASCDRKANSMRTIDDHHVGGAANDSTTTPVPVNDHRAELSVAQEDWPRQTLENPDGSPLLAGAACMRGYVDTTLYFQQELLLRRAEMLEVLDPILKQKLGPRWWVGTELEQFQGKSGTE